MEERGILERGRIIGVRRRIKEEKEQGVRDGLGIGNNGNSGSSRKTSISLSVGL